MSKDHLVLQCAVCGMFQVQQNKKSGKFTCVLCGAKQSIGKVFFRGSMAKEVRPVVQQLNMERGKRLNEEKSMSGLKKYEKETEAGEGEGEGEGSGTSCLVEKLSFQPTLVQSEDINVAPLVPGGSAEEKKRSKWEAFVDDDAMEAKKNMGDRDFDAMNGQQQYATCVPDRGKKTKKMRKMSEWDEEGIEKECIETNDHTASSHCDEAFDAAFESAFGSKQS
jgi:hypothetical protein